MLEVTTKECHGLHRYDCVSLEGDTNSQSSLRRTMTRINSWYNFQDDEIYVSHGAGDGNRCVFEHHRESGALRDDLEGHQNSLLKENSSKV